MSTASRHGAIEVWRPHDFAQLELRRGFAVTSSVPRHWHDEYQFVLGEGGVGELIYRGGTLATPPASLFMVHPGEPHSNRSLESTGCSYRTMFVDADLMRRAATEIHGRDRGFPFFPTVVAFDADVIGRFRSLHLAFEGPTSSLERHVLLLDLLTALIVRFGERRTPPRTLGADRRAVSRVRDYLIEHLAENVSLERLARIANLSPFHLNRVFSEQVGLPPHAFQTQMRISRAKALLRRGSSIPQTAAETGFADQSHLTRHFKRLVGVTPGQFRASSKNVQDESASSR
jgi:AraC-like DNA-binding protein